MGFASDVYSFGMVLWELFTNKIPYEGLIETMNEGQFLLHLIRTKEKPPLEGLSDELGLLIKDCWNTNPEKRPKFSEIYDRLSGCRIHMTKKCKIGLGIRAQFPLIHNFE